MIRFLIEKLNTKFGTPSTLVEKKYREAIRDLHKKEAVTNMDGEKQRDFVQAISCYRQYIRLFYNKLHNNKVSYESMSIAKSILNAGFDINKLDNNLGKGIQECYKTVVDMRTMYPLESNFTILSIYTDAVEVLRDKRLLSRIIRWNAELEKLVKGDVVTAKDINERKKMYQYSYLVMGYVNLIYLVIHLTPTFAMTISDLEDGTLLNETDVQINPVLLNERFLKLFHFLFYRSALNHIGLIVYYKNANFDKIEKEITRTMDTTKTREDWRLIKPVLSQEFVDPTTAALGILAAPAIAVGILLGISILLPFIRGLIYYWGSLKIDISRFFKDEAIFFTYNVIKLKKNLAETKDPKAKEKLLKVIAKQEELAKKLQDKAIKWSIEYEQAAKDANLMAEEDEKMEAMEINEEDMPDIIL